MTPLRIIDSHIHLWPEYMSNPEGHAWMDGSGQGLSKQHILSNYYKAAQQEGSSRSDATVDGVIYVETDVRYDKANGDLRTWARGPLDEIKFLRDIVEGKYGERDSQMLVGMVVWAPLDQPTTVLEEWLHIAEDVAGSETWRRIKGFRYLLQSIHDQKKFEQLVHSHDFANNLQLLGRRGFAFDVGVDQRSRGAWQLQAIAAAMEAAHLHVPEGEKVTFVVNHLCKPDFVPGDPEFHSWTKAIEIMAGMPNTFMKLSGALSELPDEVLAKKDADAIAQHMEPWVNHVLATFGSRRIMFGSDWPVCNVRGPGEEASWKTWREIVAHLLAGLSAEDRASIWSGTARRAYKLD